MKSIILALICFGCIQAQAMDANCQRFIERNAEKLIRDVESSREYLISNTHMVMNNQDYVDLQSRIIRNERLGLAVKKVQRGQSVTPSEAGLLRNLCRSNGRVIM